MKLVVGSGPAAASCAAAILEAGDAVTMIDSGLIIEPEIEARVAYLRATSPELWPRQSVDAIKGAANPTVGGLPEKFSFGSDYPYRWVDPDLKFEQDGVDTLHSFALGGLSNIWGANIVPFRQQELERWPIDLEALKPYYQRVSQIVPTSAAKDELMELLPLYSEPQGLLPPSRQATQLLRRMRRSREALRSRGIYFGHSRLAVRSTAKGAEPGCSSCGLCLYGCPWNLIYSSAQTVTELMRHPRFRYVGGRIAQRVVSSSGSVRVVTKRHGNGAAEEFQGDKAYIGCGAVGSAALLLRSLEAYGREVPLLDSQYFLVPFFTFQGAGDVTTERLHTLSQLSIEVDDRAISKHLMHMLIYTYNDLYRRAMEGMLGRLAGVGRWPMKQMLSHLSVLQGYLHSDDSVEISLRLEHTREGERLILRRGNERGGAAIIKRLLRKIAGQGGSIGGVPLSFMLQLGKPGKSYHCGGSFPMTSSPSSFQSSPVGEVVGLSNVYSIDASCFPTIPSLNHTYTVMANAMRIGRETT